MANNKPEVFEVYRTKQGTLENVVLLADYEALQIERDSYKNTIIEVTTRRFVESWSKTTADKELEQYLSDGIAQLEDEHRKQIKTLQAELEKWKHGSKIRDEQNRDLYSIVFELKAECEKLRNLAAECAEYLSYSPHTRISHSSVLHRKLIDAAMQEAT